MKRVPQTSGENKGSMMKKKGTLPTKTEVQMDMILIMKSYVYHRREIEAVAHLAQVLQQLNLGLVVRWDVNGVAADTLLVIRG